MSSKTESNRETAKKLYEAMGMTDAALRDTDTAHLVINGNMVVGEHLVPGLEVEPTETKNGVRVTVRVLEGAIIKNPVHMCFGILPEEGLQEIEMNTIIQKNSSVSILAHCTFPNAVKVVHKMDASIEIQDGASYTYLERHVHGKKSGITVLPKARVTLGKHARFATDFELLSGRVGEINIDYETTCSDFSVLEMNAKINGTGDDRINIREIGHLKGEGARGVLTSRIAVRDRARAEVYNKLTASAPFARGHVDCKEIVQDEGVATAVPIVEVNHPKAHVTHEAAIGSVDDKQLETLMARGLNEDDAVELIIQGLLS